MHEQARGPSLSAPHAPSLETLAASIPLTWRRILLALLSYGLFFTDIPRSGYGFATLPADTFNRIQESVYSYWGPYNYPVMRINRTRSGAFTGAIGVKPAAVATVWSYRSDTCSVGLRALVQHYGILGWDPCLLYAHACMNVSLDLATVFTMLDNSVASLVSRESQPTALRVESFYKDKVHEALAPTDAVMEHEFRSVQAYVMHSAYDACHALRAIRPNFCEQSQADYSTLSAPRAGIGRVSQHIQKRFALALAALDSSTQVAEMVVIESGADFRPWIGGMAIVRPRNFDIVTLLRVRNCSTPRACTTVSVDDYRYEGGLLNTNTVNTYRAVRCLRFVGQLYNIIRVGVLFYGCYLAASRRYRPALGCFLRIPAQVIIYGSWFPVLLFAMAHAMDAPFVYLLVYRAFSSVNGNLVITTDYIYFVLTMLSCHMRNVWVLSLLTKGLLLAARDHRRGQAILGFRGYVLPLVSFCSIGFEIRLLSIRNTDIVRHAAMAPSANVAAIRYLHTLPSNVRYWGLFLDLRCLLMAFLCLHIALRFLRVNVVRARSLVPYAVTSYCSSSMFSTSWNTLFVDKDASTVSMHKMATQSAVANLLYPSGGRRQAEHVLMNVAWMTDPIEYMAHALWWTSTVFVYKDSRSGCVYYHPLSLQELRTHDDDEMDNILSVVRKDTLLSLRWSDRIYTC
ncbi:hypothetical protein SDRG_01976 [Saprolegnia diclina VS20]|uniref:Uncharacterized protein n=1 Tax=Saprolegnia diclina (strain VS20) TaxID=1156394 RepID=T0R1S0_SAPDV|nr:hypothetical protein SDRG_01976 [Saprolegnia diclina VS20]EQC40911.1 hypothetical protein SDRG_01976 [Saprolegnia diclina VS20]|eukprot:XP_008605755.1 hypothetical protein SDRG_01976 [Saprolegnia diclina VS20]